HTSPHATPHMPRPLTPPASRHSESIGIAPRDPSDAPARRRLRRPDTSQPEPSSERPWPVTPAYGSSPASRRSPGGRHQGSTSCIPTQLPWAHRRGTSRLRGNVRDPQAVGCRCCELTLDKIIRTLLSPG